MGKAHFPYGRLLSHPWRSGIDAAWDERLSPDSFIPIIVGSVILEESRPGSTATTKDLVVTGHAHA